MRHAMMLGSLLLGMMVAGCSSNPPLNTDPSTSAIRAAEEVGASDVPLASLHLQLAREELARAEDLQRRGEKDEAASQLLRAEADAELAVLLSRKDAEKKEAVEARERVRQLQKDNR